MRRLFLLILLVAFLAAPLAPDAWADDVSANTMVTMEITGMTWILWAPLVKRSLEGVEGVIEAEVSFKEAKARVEITAVVTDEMLEDAVSYSGRFKGKVVSRVPADAETPWKLYRSV